MYGETYDSTVCDCPPGFRIISGNEKECRRKADIIRDSKFLQLDYVNYSGGPLAGSQRAILASNFTTCEAECLNDPECVGFGYKYDVQRYCVVVRQLYYGFWSPATEATFFLRVDKSETDKTTFTGLTSILETTCPVQVSLPLPPDESNSTTRNIAIISTLFAAELISGVAFFWVFLKKYVKYRDMARTFGLEFLPAGGPKRFTYAELKAATNDFSSTNVVGKGGFGDVYKGVLTDHRIVAVKCLKNVTGGDNKFWAEGSKMDSEEWYFPRWAFDKVYKEMNIEDILDNHIKGSYDSRLHEDMITRMVKTAIWCLQDRPEMRPSMGKVAKMLEGTVEIIEPKKPTIFFLGDD
ncbi:hypothetical protein L1987_79184 [Smallanthus sonchifolius]|uniref:Uncharacterized protein n=1 Tax=Smallanthus sonchifolius TaxID=185202 RepID=A0ACB8ZFS7_9ASTR|nr:hypothetical protein L1987_79184 [Smallanthus sonchifolius]